MVAQQLNECRVMVVKYKSLNVLMMVHFQIDVVSRVRFLRGVFKSDCSDFMENKHNPAAITGNSFTILRVSDVGNDSVHLRSVWM